MRDLHQHNVEGGHDESEKQSDTRRQLQEHGHTDVRHDPAQVNVLGQVTGQVTVTILWRQSDVGDERENVASFAAIL